MNQEFNRELERLFERTAPEPIAVDVEELIKNAKSTVTRKERSMRTRAIVLAATAGLLLVLAFLPLMPSKAGNAFAQVKNQIEKIESLSYVQVTYSITSDTPNDVESNAVDFSQPKGAEPIKDRLGSAIETIRKRLDNEGSQARLELSYQLELLESLSNEPDAKDIEDVRRIRIKEKYLQRTDHVFPYANIHDVIDAKSNLNVVFLHDQKRRRVLTKQVVLDRKSNEKSEHELRLSPSVDFFTQFRSVPNEAKKLAEKRIIDGQQAIGFQTIEKHNGTWLRSYWVDSESYLPLEIVTEFRSELPQLSSARWVQKEFAYNMEMDTALFSTETPTGYTSEESELQGYKL